MGMCTICCAGEYTTDSFSFFVFFYCVLIIFVEKLFLFVKQLCIVFLEFRIIVLRAITLSCKFQMVMKLEVVFQGF